MLLGPLLTLGVPVSWRAGKSSIGFEFTQEGDRRTMTVTSTGDPWTLEEARDWVAPALAACDWVHVAPLLRGEFSPDTLEEIARKRTLSLDAQGLARLAEPGPLQLDPDFDRELLRHVTVLKLAEEEAGVLLGEMINAKSLASLGVPEVIVTRGSKGAIVYANGELTELPARPTVANVDTTGAGDEFAAIYIVARSRGRAPVLAARQATAFVGAMLDGRLAAS